MANQATIQLVSKALNKRSSTEISAMFKWKDSGSTRQHGSHQVKTESTLKRKGPNLLDRGRELHNKLPLTLRNNSLKPGAFKRSLKVHTLDNNQLLKH